MKSLKVKKDTKIGTFLDSCRKELAKEYTELRHISGESLMLILQEFIIPQSASFYDILVSNIEGKKGLLLQEKKKA